MKGPSKIDFTTTNEGSEFDLDIVHPEDANQAAVWANLAPTVGKFTAGHNVTVMAFGAAQTGKSFTLGTGDYCSSDTGILQRATRSIFQQLLQPSTPTNSLSRASSLKMPTSISSTSLAVHKMSSQIPRPFASSNARTTRPAGAGHQRHRSIAGTSSASSAPLTSGNAQKQWSVLASYLQINNDELCDLQSNSSLQGLLEIVEDAKGQVSVIGLKDTVVENYTQVLQLLEKCHNAHTRPNNCHRVFTLKLVRRHTIKESNIMTTTMSKYNFVDLAAPSDDNNRLDNLTTILEQLNFPPEDRLFKTSKLTRILQDSIGRRCFTHVVACVSKDKKHAVETLSTLNTMHQIKEAQSFANPQSLLDQIDSLEEELRLYRRAEDTVILSSAYDGSHSFSVTSPTNSDFDSSRELTDNTDLTVETHRNRTDRSLKFHTAVETVLSDYEKTISSLQTSLLESRSFAKEAWMKFEDTNRELEIKTAQLEEYESSYGEIVEMAESFEKQLDLSRFEQDKKSRELEESRTSFEGIAKKAQVLEEELNALKLEQTSKIQTDFGSPSNLPTSPNSQSGNLSSAESSPKNNRLSLSSNPELALEKELYLLREQFKSSQLELKGLRAAHKSHSTESQYLTSRYNSCRRETDELREENKALKEQLEALKSCATNV